MISVYLQEKCQVVTQRKAKVQPELKYEMDIEGSKKSCCCYINSRRIKKEKACLLLSGVGDLVTINADEAEVLDAFSSIKEFYQVFVPTGRIWGGEEQPVVEEAEVRELLKS